MRMKKKMNEMFILTLYSCVPNTPLSYLNIGMNEKMKEMIVLTFHSLIPDKKTSVFPFLCSICS